MARTIIVSDLHVDTWDKRKYGRGERRKTKLEHWCDFLDWCAQQQVAELIVNGDLLDAPPYQGNVSFHQPITRDAVERLLAYAGGHKVTYIYGNHDIGISGIRCARGTTLPSLGTISLLYPDYVLSTAQSTILIQHGHLFDPVLCLYVRDLTMRTYISSHFQAFQWVQQRRDPQSGEQLQPPGVASPARIGLGPDVKNNVFHAIKVADAEAPPSAAQVSSARNWIEKLKQGIFRKLRREVTHYIWWAAAKTVCADYLQQGDPAQPTLYCVLGHTHVPDSGQVQLGDTKCLYLNSGTWTGQGKTVEDRQHATYLDVDPQGTIWIQDWIRDRWP